MLVHVGQVEPSCLQFPSFLLEDKLHLRNNKNVDKSLHFGREEEGEDSPCVGLAIRNRQGVVKHKLMDFKMLKSGAMRNFEVGIFKTSILQCLSKS